MDIIKKIKWIEVVGTKKRGSERPKRSWIQMMKGGFASKQRAKFSL